MSSTPKKCYPALLLLIFMFLGAACNQNPADDDEKDDDVLTIMPVAPAIDSYPAWSPDGSTIAFYHHGVVYDATLDMEVHHPDSVGLWFISPDGSNKRMFLRGADLPAWGPRGRWLAFKYGQIYKIKANGDSLTQLTFEGRNHFPAWSPDGKWIAYDNTNCGGPTEPIPPNSCGILIVKSDGSNKRFIVAGRFPIWSPHGGNLLFVGAGSEIFRVDVNDTSEYVHVQLTSFNQNYTYVDLRYPQYSPDGLKIAFHSSMEPYGVWVMDSDGSHLRRLTQESGGHTSWSPDSQKIVFRGPETTLWIMDPDGKNKRQLTFRPKPN